MLRSKTTPVNGKMKETPRVAKNTDTIVQIDVIFITDTGRKSRERREKKNIRNKNMKGTL